MAMLYQKASEQDAELSIEWIAIETLDFADQMQTLSNLLSLLGKTYHATV